MDQATSLHGGLVITPLRAALFVLGAVLGGVALSLILGSSPAHAADGDGSGSGQSRDAVGSVTSLVSTTVTSTADHAIPPVQFTLRAVGGSVVTAIPAAAPVVTPVVTALDTTLSAVHDLVTPITNSVLMPLAPHAFAGTADRALAPSTPVQMVPGASSGTAAGALPVAQGGAGSGGSPLNPILTSSPGAPVAALGVLLTLIALALLGARRRLDDDALPASPTFETDTSPA